MSPVDNRDNGHQDNSGWHESNTRATCRASVRAVFDAVGNTNAATLDICIKQEESARAEMDRDWATYPAADKEQCVHPKQFSPSYVEWLTCLENRREARKLPKQ